MNFSYKALFSLKALLTTAAVLVSTASAAYHVPNDAICLTQGMFHMII